MLCTISNHYNRVNDFILPLCLLLLYLYQAHIGYCLIDIYLAGITIINKFKYIRSTDEGIFMYHHLPISINNDYE